MLFNSTTYCMFYITYASNQSLRRSVQIHLKMNVLRQNGLTTNVQKNDKSSCPFQLHGLGLYPLISDWSWLSSGPFLDAFPTPVLSWGLTLLWCQHGKSSWSQKLRPKVTKSRLQEVTGPSQEMVVQVGLYRACSKDGFEVTAFVKWWHPCNSAPSEP